jgi:hypothetical protein
MATSLGRGRCIGDGLHTRELKRLQAGPLADQQTTCQVGDTIAWPAPMANVKVTNRAVLADAFDRRWLLLGLQSYWYRCAGPPAVERPAVGPSHLGARAAGSVHRQTRRVTVEPPRHLDSALHCP